MKIKRNIYLLITTLLITSCSITLDNNKKYVDDLYYTNDDNNQTEVNQEMIEELDSTIDYTNENPYDEILVDNYEDAYERRKQARKDPYYGMTNYYTVLNSDDYWYASTYDPAFYNMIIMGNSVWVEPKWISTGYGYGIHYGNFYNHPMSSWGISFSRYPYSMNSFYPYTYNNYNYVRPYTTYNYHYPDKDDQGNIRKPIKRQYRKYENKSKIRRYYKIKENNRRVKREKRYYKRPKNKSNLIRNNNNVRRYNNIRRDNTYHKINNNNKRIRKSNNRYYRSNNSSNNINRTKSSNNSRINKSTNSKSSGRKRR